MTRTLLPGVPGATPSACITSGPRSSLHEVPQHQPHGATPAAGAGGPSHQLGARP